MCIRDSTKCDWNVNRIRLSPSITSESGCITLGQLLLEVGIGLELGKLDGELVLIHQNHLGGHFFRPMFVHFLVQFGFVIVQDGL